MMNLDAASDNTLPDLITAACAGDQQACTAIYQCFVRAAYRLAYGILLNEQDAEEVVQDSFTYAFQNLHRYDPTRSAFRTWLYTITMSRCRNKRRRKWLPTINLTDVVEWLPGFDPHPEAIIEQHSLREMVWDALRKLSPKLREAVVLRYFDGLTYREMGEVLNCPQKTAESRVRLAHEALYRILADRTEILGKRVFGHD